MVIGALGGAAADIIGEVTSLSLYSHASEALGVDGQRPMFKANLDQPVLLRTAAPEGPGLVAQSPSTIFRPDMSKGRKGAAGRPDEEHEGIPGGDKLRMSDDWVEFQGSEKQTELDHLKFWRGAGLVYRP